MEIGIDVIEIDRIKEAYKKYGEHFLERILFPSEIKYCQSKSIPPASIAGRIAAKEAFAKAVGTGIGGKVPWLSVEVQQNENNKPSLLTHKNLSVDVQEMIIGKKISLSISHTTKLATAVVVIL